MTAACWLVPTALTAHAPLATSGTGQPQNAQVSGAVAVTAVQGCVSLPTFIVMWLCHRLTGSCHCEQNRILCAAY
jgi:hypothetical protein